MIPESSGIIVSGHYFDKIALGLTGTSSFLSIVGAICIFRSYRTLTDPPFVWRLVLQLTFADLGTASGYFLSVVRFGVFAAWDGATSKEIANDTTVIGIVQDNLCTVQSFFTTSSNIASFLWTFVIVVYINLAIRRKGNIIKNYYVCIHRLFWISPVLVALVCAAFQVLGDNQMLTGPWCWINTDKSGIGWMLFAGKFWEILAYALSILCLICFYKERNNEEAEQKSEEEDFKRKYKQFAFILVVLSIARLWGTIRVLMYVSKAASQKPVQDASDILLYFQAIGDPSQAFCNFVCLCLLWDKEIRQNIKQQIRDDCKRVVRCLRCKMVESGQENANERYSLINSRT